MLSKLGSRAAVAAATLALVVVSACSFTADVLLSHEFRPVTAPWSVDLQKEASGAWNRRDSVTGVRVVGIEASVTRVGAGAVNQAVSGNLVLSRNGQSVIAGTYTNHTLAANTPDSLEITLQDAEAAAALMKAALQDDGKLTVTASASPGVDFDLKITVHLSIDFDVKL